MWHQNVVTLLLDTHYYQNYQNSMELRLHSFPVINLADKNQVYNYIFIFNPYFKLVSI